jgi:Flp pilus assembly protein TadD
MPTTPSQAVSLPPTQAEAHYNRGNAFVARGQFVEAMACYQQALRLQPNFAAAQGNLGVTYAELGRLDEAVACYNQALQLQPNNVEASYNLGNALREKRQFAHAVPHYEHVLRLRPGFAEAHCNLGLTYAELGELDEAVVCYHRALGLQPDGALAHNNLGDVLRTRGQFAAALARYEQALRLQPDFPAAHYNRALVLLARGDFEHGWAEYEWRWRLKNISLPALRQPLWDGSPLAGRTILLHAEQGLGDTLQFIRYAPLVKSQGGTVVAACQRPLLGILETCPGIDRLVAKDSPLPEFDVHAPLLSLPRLLGTTLENVPADIPYLLPDARLVDFWRRELGAFETFKIGIAWQGSTTYREDRYRSIPLVNFEPLARVEGVQLFSLQKGPGSEQVGAVADRFVVVDLAERLDEPAGGFLDTAAVTANLDLVITSDTSIGHLAGALGVPVWIALAVAPDWRWLLHRDDSPWYPTVRLFRQREWGNWAEVFERIAGALRDHLGRPSAQAARVEIGPGELLDKISILEIKTQRIADPAKLRNVRTELATLVAARDRSMTLSEEMKALAADLKSANEAIWEAEEELRLRERAGDFGPRFVEVARSVYHHNDRRAAIKRRINELAGARLVEEKAYQAYE